MEAVKYVQRHGVGLFINTDGTLRVYPAARVDACLRAYIREHEDDIIAALQTPDIEMTVANILARAPEELRDDRW